MEKIYEDNLNNVIYLKIAGFYFRIYFWQTPFNLHRIAIYSEIHKFYQGFLLDKKPKKIDCYIDFRNRLTYKLLYDKKSNNKYASISRGCVEDNKYIFYYQISIFQFQLLLRDILSDLLVKGHGFILHSSANNFKGKIILFTGNSGAGKSTAMEYVDSKYPGLADDNVIIRKENEHYVFYQTPMTEKVNLTKSHASYEISRVFFPIKSKEFNIKKISKKDYVLKLFMQQFWTKDKIFMKKQVKYVIDFVSQFNEFYFLYFAKNKNKLISLLEQ